MPSMRTPPALAASAALLAVIGGCASDTAPTAPHTLQQTSFQTLSVAARAETVPMQTGGDAADDPAIWLHPADPAASLVLGTNKREGLYAYALDGSVRQFLPVGPLNNVDLRGTLAVGSLAGLPRGALSWFRIERRDGTITHLGDTPVDDIRPYGICLGDIPDGRLLVGVTYKAGRFELYSVGDAYRLPQSVTLERTLPVGEQLEGCVFDDGNQRVFIGEETGGIWSLDISTAEADPVNVDRIAAGNGLAEDVEGLALWLGATPDEGWLVASAQGADRFVVYDRVPPHAPRGVFSITGQGSIDAVSHTDGIAVSSHALPGYPRGLLVAQDDANPLPQADQNFKLVSWADIEAELGLEALAQPGQ